MKKKVLITSLLVFIIVIDVLQLIINKNNKNDDNLVRNNFPNEFLNITYQQVRDDKFVNACLTFEDNNKYTLYDCDSEPTEFPFDSEWECTPYYNDKQRIIVFKCKSGTTSTIDILTWNKNEFIFKFDGKDYLFKRNN